MTSYPPPGQYPPPPAGYPPPGQSPPPPPGTPAAPVKAPPVAWLVPVAALLAVIGLFTPWFEPQGTLQGRDILKSGDGLYSWKDGKIGLLAPIVLVIVAVSVVSLLQGKARGRFASGANPVRSVAKFSIGAGLASAVCVAIAWFLVPGQYHFTFSGATYSWSKLEDAGVDLTRGPQLGYFLTIAAAVIAIIGGVVMLATTKPVAAAPRALPYYGPPPGVPRTAPAPPVQNQGFAPPPAGYPPPPTSLEKPPPAR